jgi:dTDP-4-dehydrorhamnose reductase
MSRILSDFDLVVNCALPNQGPARNAREAERLAQALAGVGEGTAVMHLSSVAVYGNCFVAGRTRFERPCPDDRYGREKLDMERLIWPLARRRGVRLWICRLGHVYGPGLNWSKIVFNLIADQDFRLPFDGAKPSNAIYLQNIAAAAKHLAATRAESAIYNLVDSPQQSWREIFDLHSKALDTSSVSALSEAESAAVYAQFRSGCGRGLMEKLSLDVAHWLVGLPSQFIAYSKALQTVAEMVLARMKSDELESRLKARYWRAIARNRCNGLRVAGPLGCFSSDAVPGPCLGYSGVTASPDLGALAEYERSLTQPL